MMDGVAELVGYRYLVKVKWSKDAPQFVEQLRGSNQVDSPKTVGKVVPVKNNAAKNHFQAT